MYRSYQGLCFISVVLLTLTGCASKATAPPPKPTVAPAPVKSLVNTCKPLDAKTKQAISGDSRMADQLDEPARTLEGDMTAAGQCNISNIRRMVRWKSKQVLRCYDEAKGARAGRVVMRWEVTGAGKVGGLCVKEDAVKSAPKVQWVESEQQRAWRESMDADGRHQRVSELARKTDGDSRAVSQLDAEYRYGEQVAKQVEKIQAEQAGEPGAPPPSQMLESAAAKKARRGAKRDMRAETDPVKKSLANGRQLALKISANSIFFCWGTNTNKYYFRFFNSTT